MNNNSKIKLANMIPSIIATIPAVIVALYMFLSSSSDAIFGEIIDVFARLLAIPAALITFTIVWSVASYFKALITAPAKTKKKILCATFAILGVFISIIVWNKADASLKSKAIEINKYISSNTDQHLICDNEIYFLDDALEYNSELTDEENYLSNINKTDTIFLYKIKNDKKDIAKQVCDFDFTDCSLIAKENNYIYFENAAGHFNKINIDTGEVTAVSENECFDKFNITLSDTDEEKFVCNGKTYLLPSKMPSDIYSTYLYSVDKNGHREIVYDDHVHKIYAVIEPYVYFESVENNYCSLNTKTGQVKKLVESRHTFASSYGIVKDNKFYIIGKEPEEYDGYTYHYVYEVSGSECKPIFENDCFAYPSTQRLVDNRYLLMSGYVCEEGVYSVALFDLNTGKAEVMDNYLRDKEAYSMYTFTQNDKTYIALNLYNNQPYEVYLFDENSLNFISVDFNQDDIPEPYVENNTQETELFYDEKYTYLKSGNKYVVSDKNTNQELYCAEPNPSSDDEFIVEGNVFYTINDGGIHRLYLYNTSSNDFEEIYNITGEEITNVYVKDDVVIIGTKASVATYNLSTKKLNNIKVFDNNLTSKNFLYTVDLVNNCIYTTEHDRTTTKNPLAEITKTPIS